MIINNSDVIKRLESPLNLINRLRSAGSSEKKKDSAMSLFGINRSSSPKIEAQKPLATETAKPSFNPFEQKSSLPIKKDSSEPQAAVTITERDTTLDNIIDNHDSQIKLGLAHDKALELLNNSVAMLATKLDDVKADKLPAVISAASKTVESIRRERAEASKSGKDREVHYHFYTPVQKTVSDFEVIDVTS